ncbi:MAG: trypsin-like peptidase domain-containing protein, partial [Actinobacteria bacterium]|nr:trypsin-like peptidase domain-containing protein [Actinomycetota bacterium]
MSEPPPVAPLEQVQALVQPAVVYEQITWSGYVYDETNKGYFTQEPFVTSFQCTGFIVNPDGYIATAGHCVDYDATVREAILSQVVEWAYANEYYEATPSMETIATFARNWRIDGASTEGTADLDVSVAYGVTVSGEPSGKALPARVVDLRPVGEGDVALLKIEAENLTVLPLSDNSTTGVGTEVVAVGYPASVDLVTDASFNPSFKEGTISAEKTTEGGLLPVYEISAAVSGGMSGGPTVGLTGDVIGVNSFKIEGETQPFNFVQPSSNIDELLRAEGVENTLGPVTEQYRAGLAAYFAGDREVAIENFDAVLSTVPSHQFAQDYLQKA